MGPPQNWGLIACAGIVLDILVQLFWKPYLSGYAEEKGKRLAKEDIDNVIEQVRAVTLETESIRTQMQSGLWERQIRERIARTIANLDALRKFLIEVARKDLGLANRPSVMRSNLDLATLRAALLRRYSGEWP